MVPTGNSDGSINGNGVALQSDGKIIVAANHSRPPSWINDVMVLRYDSSGALDGSFGSSGVFNRNNSYASAVTIQKDGKILVAGGEGGRTLMALRLTDNGGYDATFAANGVFSYSNGFFADVASALALQPDNKILLTGSSYNSANYPGLMALRLNSDGSQDSAFGAFTYHLDGEYLGGMGIGVQSDGRIVIAGYANSGYLLFRLYGAMPPP